MLWSVDMHAQEHGLFELGQKVLWFQDDRCLVLEFEHARGQWDIPGGRVARGEDLAAALTRELHEEVGLAEWQSLGIAGYAVVNRSKKPILLVATVIAAEKTDVQLSDEHVSYRWVNREELTETPFLHSEVRGLVEKGFDFIEHRDGK